jgi:hypothetical protein
MPFFFTTFFKGDMIHSRERMLKEWKNVSMILNSTLKTANKSTTTNYSSTIIA